MPKKLNLKDQVFGDLIVIKEVDHKPVRWLCQCICDNTIIIATAQLRAGTRSCGCFRRKVTSLTKSGQNHPNWKGGRYVHRGYVMIRPKLARELYPNAVFDSGHRSILEHQVVMSDYLKRALLPAETVHHLNGIKTDNRIENLELWSGNHGHGERVEDLVAWAKEFLQQYEPSALALQGQEQ